MKKLLIWLCTASLFYHKAEAQKPQELTINQCYALAEQNYPLIRQRELISKTTAYTVANLAKAYLPQLSINAQASYQSEVTKLPVQLPGMTALSKDQYKMYGEINQLLYDGGAIKNEQELQQANAELEQQQLSTALYQLKDRVNQLFFGLLLLDEQVKQNELLVSDIKLALKKVDAQITNGTALRSNGDVLKAELLKNTQRLVELNSSHRAFATMLSLLTGMNISSATVLVKPSPILPAKQINRIELQTYAQQEKILGVQSKMLSTKALPKVSLFFQGGAGRPALNMLNNDFRSYYIGGIRLLWSPSVFYTLKKEREINQLNMNKVGVQRETFLFNTELMVTEQDAELHKYAELLSSDEEIIQLRARIKTAATAQLENGVINSNDFLREANAENIARQNKTIHQIQLLLAQYKHQTTTGNL